MTVQTQRALTAFHWTRRGISSCLSVSHHHRSLITQTRMENHSAGGYFRSRHCFHARWSSSYPPHTLYPMPALSPTMEHGTITSWHKNEGDAFTAGDVLCQIETDKATLDFESQDDGIIAKILKEGDSAKDIKIGVPICVVVDEEEDVAVFSEFVLPETDAVGLAPSPAETVETSEVPKEKDMHSSGSSSLFPSARYLAESKGLDASVLQGSGKGGRVTKGDVLQAIASGVVLPPISSKPVALAEAAQAPRPPPTSALTPTAAPEVAPLVTVSVPIVEHSGTYEEVPNNNMRKVIARRLTESKRDVPHFYTSASIELDNVFILRKSLASNHDVKVSVNDFILKSSAMALRDVPEVNSSYDPKTGEISMSDTVDISVAVATPTGLITPIVTRVDKIGLVDISLKVRDLATRARDGKLLPEEYQGGTFTVSNLGMFGVDEFSAVINPPQAAILAVGGGSKKMIPSQYVDGAIEQPKPQVRTVMTARLSADRRVVDEPTAALFMQALTHYLSTPNSILL